MPKALFWLSLGALAILVSAIVIPAIPVVGCLAVNDTALTACTATIAVAVFVSTWLIVVGGIVAITA